MYRLSPIVLQSGSAVALRIDARQETIFRGEAGSSRCRTYRRATLHLLDRLRVDVLPHFMLFGFPIGVQD